MPRSRSPLNKSNVRHRSFYPLLQKAGLPRIRFNDLWHAYATLLSAQGIHPRIVQEQLGHSRSIVTLGTYSHVLPNIEQAADAMDRPFTDTAAAGVFGSC